MSEVTKPVKRILDKDLDKLTRVEEAAGFLARDLLGPGLALVFLAFAALFASVYVLGEPSALFVIMAAAFAAYMALNIGANDVANNVGPAVGARVITMTGALIMAAVCEAAGALLAGGGVVETVASGIIRQDAVHEPWIFLRVMLAALISASLWINLATWLRAPISTTHAIVGSVCGAGVAAAGLYAVNWASMGAITASWVVSPFLGGAIAAAFLSFIEARIVYQDDKIAAARYWVPILIALMAGAFAAYMATLGIGRVVTLEAHSILGIGLVAMVVTWTCMRPVIRQQSRGLENRNQSLRRLFTAPLIVSAGLLSFAHGANDVANAVGPLAAIVEVADFGQTMAVAIVPAWVMMIGALGLSVGLLLFGPRLIRMVGEQITKLNPIRAYCIAIATGTTVLIASWFGMPVSSTHIAVGAVFGVGFYREWAALASVRRRSYLQRRSEQAGHSVLAPSANPGSLAAEPAAVKAGSKKRSRQEIARRRLVRRAHFTTIVAAWVLTVPGCALLAALIFQLLRAVA